MILVIAEQREGRLNRATWESIAAAQQGADGPVKIAVLPLSRNEDLTPRAKVLATELRQQWNVEFDDSGAIGRRYRRQDEIGTPYCVTVDFESLDDKAVTVRDRDTLTQDRVPIDGLVDHLREKLAL